MTDQWMQDYMAGFDAFNDGAPFDATKSDAWKDGWNMAREDDEKCQAIVREDDELDRFIKSILKPS